MNTHGDTLDEAGHTPERGGASRLIRRPRVLAGGSLGLAAIGAGLVIALSAGGAAAPTKAFAVDQHSDGSILVQLNSQEDLGQANQKLAAMGTGEQIELYSNPHPTASSAVEDCTAAPGSSSAPNPPIQLSVYTTDADNTGVTGAVLCYVVHSSGSSSSTGSGSTGTGNS